MHKVIEVCREHIQGHPQSETDDLALGGLLLVPDLCCSSFQQDSAVARSGTDLLGGPRVATLENFAGGGSVDNLEVSWGWRFA